LAFALYTLEIYILYVTLDLFRYAKINARNYAIIAVYAVIMTLLNYQCNSRFYKIKIIITMEIAVAIIVH